MRGHAGPSWGAYFFGYADELADMPGVLEYRVGMGDADGADLTPAQLVELAQHALAAQAWLEARR